MTPEQATDIVRILENIYQELSCLSFMFFLYLVSKMFGDKK